MQLIIDRLIRAYELGKELVTDIKYNPLDHRLFDYHHQCVSYFIESIKSFDDLIKFIRDNNYKHNGNILPGPNGSIYITLQMDDVIGTEILSYPLDNEEYEIVKYKNQLVATGANATIKNAGLVHTVTFVLTRMYSTAYNTEWFILSDAYPGYPPRTGNYTNINVEDVYTGKELSDRLIERITFI